MLRWKIYEFPLVLYSSWHKKFSYKRRPSKWEQCQFFPKKASSKPSKFFKTEPTPQSHIYNLLEVIFSYESHIIHLLRGGLRMGYPAQLQMLNFINHTIPNKFL